MTKNKKIKHQKGNAFLLVMLGIALFAALGITVSRSMRSDSTKKLSDREAHLAATDILDHAQKLERTVNRLRRKNISENDLSFDQNFVAGYAHAQPDSHKIFHSDGGALRWKTPLEGSNDGSDWFFTGSTIITNLETINQELIAVLPNVAQSVCEAIDKRLNIGNIPSDTGSGYSTTKFTGSFTADKEITLASGPFESACYKDGNDYIFYSVLIAR